MVIPKCGTWTGTWISISVKYIFRKQHIRDYNTEPCIDDQMATVAHSFPICYASRFVALAANMPSSVDAIHKMLATEFAVKYMSHPAAELPRNVRCSRCALVCVCSLNGKKILSVPIVNYTSTLGLRLGRRCDQFPNGWYIY